MGRITANELFEYLKKRDSTIEIYGNVDTEIAGFSSLKHYRTGSITWIKKQDVVELHNMKVTAVICSRNIEIEADVKIVTDNPKDIFFAAVEYLDKQEIIPQIAQNVVLGKNVQIGENVFIGDYCVIGDNVQIDDDTVIEAHVVIYKNVKIGKRCFVKAGAVIGGEGYGYSKRNHKYYRIRHHGGVIIGNDVEIGSNTCVDCGTIDDTVIGNGVKIDNLCHIAHNVIIESNTAVVAHSTICGSAHIGKEVYIAPDSVIMNQINVGDGAIIGMGAGIVDNVPKNTVNVGFPARTVRGRTEEDWQKY